MDSICYVTCYFDINRSKWEKFARSFKDYLIYFKPFVNLFHQDNNTKDHLIVFIDDRYIAQMSQIIVGSRITLIPINLRFLECNIPCWSKLSRERDIMDSAYFKRLVGSRITFPECIYPEYTLINHSKIDFICYVMSMGWMSELENYCWVDFGFFAKIESIPLKLLDISHFNMEKINYTLINPILPQDNDVFYTLKYAPEKIGGFFFLGRREKLYEFQALYHQCLEEFQCMNICDDDQALVLYSYFKRPELFSFNDKNYGWHNVLVINQRKEKQQRRKKKVISFCLWGSEKRYVVGLIENIKLAKLYYPEWICYVYIHKKSLIDNNLWDKLKPFDNVEIMVKNDDEVIRSKRWMLWRIEPMSDPDVELFISRDIDTRILLREVLAVRQWIDSGKDVHIMRDHPQHYNKILGGMFGVRTVKFRTYDWQGLIESYYKLFGEFENDQHFLEKYIYNMTSLEDKVIHDEIKKYEGTKNCLNFPILFEQNLKFVGCYVYEDGQGDVITEKVLKDYVTDVIPDRMSQYIVSLEDKLVYLQSKIDCIYVIHYTKLVERKKMMIDQLRAHCLNIYFDILWEDKFDREIINYEGREGYSNVINRSLTRGEIANMMAHESVLKRLGNNKISLVIEDDCIFKNDYVHHLYQTVKLLEEKNTWDMCCLGGPVELNVYPARALDKSTEMIFGSDYLEIFTPTSPAPCTVSSMLYNGRNIGKVLESQYLREPYQCPSDHALWLANIEQNGNMKWVQPFITYEGSKTDLFETSFTDRGF